MEPATQGENDELGSELQRQCNVMTLMDSAHNV